ncbi:hypothetical protein RVM25_37010, partial [Enterobacter hormaechei subsp. xiangfangensis]
MKNNNYQQLTRTFQRLSRFSHLSSIASWDMFTMMPPGGSAERLGCQKACVLPENPASYRVVRTKSYLFNKATAYWSTLLTSRQVHSPQKCRIIQQE